jgi:hypothetical protein
MLFLALGSRTPRTPNIGMSLPVSQHHRRSPRFGGGGVFATPLRG